MSDQKITKKLTLGPLPASKKIYVQSERFSDVKVAMRQIQLAETSDTKNFTVYDTDIQRVLPASSLPSFCSP